MFGCNWNYFWWNNLNPVVLGIVNGAGVVVAGIGKKIITREKLRCQGLHLQRMKRYWLNSVQH